MNFRLQLTDNFTKRYTRLQKHEREAIDAKLKLLARDPWHPSLRLKKIQTTNLFEASVNMDIRVVVDFADDVLIVLLGIGHHDDVLRRQTRRWAGHVATIVSNCCSVCMRHSGRARRSFRRPEIG